MDKETIEGFFKELEQPDVKFGYMEAEDKGDGFEWTYANRTLEEPSKVERYACLGLWTLRDILKGTIGATIGYTAELAAIFDICYGVEQKSLRPLFVGVGLYIAGRAFNNLRQRWKTEDELEKRLMPLELEKMVRDAESGKEKGSK